MSKITNNSLTGSGTGCFIAVGYRPIWQQIGIKGLIANSVSFQRKFKNSENISCFNILNFPAFICQDMFDCTLYKKAETRYYAYNYLRGEA